MNISKKAIMSFLVALTSVVAMAQPYYHIMKEENGKLTEETGYNGKDYNIKISMEGPKPKDAIGDKITVPCSKRSFYFTNKGNVYYNDLEGKFYFEKSQLEYELWPGSVRHHYGLFCFGNDIKSCINPNLGWSSKEKELFYFDNPDNLGKLQEDLGNEKWAVLTSCEWEYVIHNLGEYGWKVNGKTCYLIDTTPGKSLLTELRNKNNGNPRDLSIDEFKSLEAQGLVCLPASGLLKNTSFYGQNITGYYWSSTPSNDTSAGQGKAGTHSMDFDSSRARTWSGPKRSLGYAVRLVILAD